MFFAIRIIFFCLIFAATIRAWASDDSMNDPGTYMDQFCQTIYPGMNSGPVCLNWFRHAVKHCSKMRENKLLRRHQLWTIIKHFLFPEKPTEVMMSARQIPIKIHPGHLTEHDCEALYLDIVKDFALKAPKYEIELKENAMLWQILLFQLGVCVPGAVFTAAVMVYQKQKERLKQPWKKGFAPQKCLIAAAQRRIRIENVEVSRLRVKKLLQPEEIFSFDKWPVLTMKVNNKLQFLDSIITGSMHSTGRLFRLPEQITNYREGFKVQSVRKALKFVGKETTNLMLLVVVENEPKSEDVDDVLDKSIETPKTTLSPPKVKSRMDGQETKRKQVQWKF